MHLVELPVGELAEEPKCANDVVQIMDAVLIQLDAMKDCNIPAIHVHHAIEALRKS